MARRPATPALRVDVEERAKRRRRGSARGAGAGRSTRGESPGGQRGSTSRRFLTPGAWRWLRRGLIWGSVAAIWVVILVGGVIAYYAYDLPSVSAIGEFHRRPSVRLVDSEGRPLAAFGDLYGEPVTVDSVPPYLPQAVMAVEDRRFYSHGGVDPWGIARAMIANITAGELREGGSTITQQLAKNLFLTPDRTIKRKVQEMLLAFWLETKLSKDRILSLYLNRVYLGAGTYGVDAAARRYFGKPAREIGLYEAAMIAGLLKAPSRYNPANDPDLAHSRASIVLRAMADVGFISDSEAEGAIEQRQRGEPQVADRGRYFADWALSRVAEEVGTLEGDVVVSTTLDSGIQRIAEEEVAKLLDGAARQAGVSQAAVVVISNDGAVKAMVGGRSYSQSQFNRAVQALRQPGSTFKPFVYLAALETGMTPDSPILDAPIEFKTPQGVWRPANFDRQYRGMVTLREALARSLNTPAVRLAQQVGVERLASTAHRLGITTPLAKNLSLALGSAEVSLIDMATAYAALANGGEGVWPHGVSRIETLDGRLLFSRHGNGPGRVVSPQAQAGMVEMLQAAVAWGTARHGDPGRPAAGKTGTSQDYRDAWYVGFTADWTVAVWLGNDDGTPMDGVTGGTLPAKLWHAIVTRISEGLPPRPLTYATAVPRGPQPAAPTEDEPGLLENLLERLTGGSSSRSSSGGGRSGNDGYGSIGPPGNDR